MRADATTGVGVMWSAVTVTVGDRNLVDAVDLAVPAGSWTAVLGPNGAGKTTLLRTLTASVAYTGHIRIGDDDPNEHTRRDRARQLAFVPQHPVIPPGVTVFEYVLLGRTPHQGFRLSASLTDRRRVAAVLDRLDLGRFTGRTLDTLSGGAGTSWQSRRSRMKTPRSVGEGRVAIAPIDRNPAKPSSPARGPLAGSVTGTNLSAGKSPFRP